MVNRMAFCRTKGAIFFRSELFDGSSFDSDISPVTASFMVLEDVFFKIFNGETEAHFVLNAATRLFSSRSCILAK